MIVSCFFRYTPGGGAGKPKKGKACFVQQKQAPRYFRFIWFCDPQGQWATCCTRAVRKAPLFFSGSGKALLRPMLLNCLFCYIHNAPTITHSRTQSSLHSAITPRRMPCRDHTFTSGFAWSAESLGASGSAGPLDSTLKEEPLDSTSEEGPLDSTFGKGTSEVLLLPLALLLLTSPFVSAVAVAARSGELWLL